MAKNLIISSPEFIEDGTIPKKYTADGQGVNPPLIIDDIPEGTQYMALIMDDPDAARGLVTHWLLWDIEVAGSIGEDTDPGVSGRNTLGKTGYLPPNPPPASGNHRYFFHIYALDTGLNLKTGSSREALETAMDGHVLASGMLMAHYGRVTEHA